MSWAVAGSRLALMLRRLRGRFGISAPHVAVRTYVPWYLRVLLTFAVILLSVTLAVWAYDAGRKFAGFDRSASGQTIDDLRQANLALEDEVGRLRSLLTANESTLQIEQATQSILTERNNALALENVRLKEDLAVFSRLVKAEGRRDDGVKIERLKVEPDGIHGRYRYSFMLALQGERRGKDAKFNLQIVITPRGGGANPSIVLPHQGNSDSASYAIELRNFRRIEGRFDVPSGVAVGSVEMRILEAGVVMVGQSLNL